MYRNNFRVNSVIPYAWDNSKSVYEMIGKLVNKINEVIKAFNGEVADQIAKELAEQLKDFTIEQIRELMLTGEVAQFIYDYIEEAFGVSLDKIKNTQPYNIGLDEHPYDITGYLNDLILALPPGKEIYIPSGEYQISGKVHFRHKTVIRGDRKGTVIHVVDNAQFVQAFGSELSDMTFEAEETYSGKLFYLDGQSGLTWEHERMDSGIFRLDVNKVYNVDYKSVFLTMLGQNLGGTLLHGYYGFTAHDINISGFSVPLEMKIVDGWLHANIFSNWKIKYFERAIVMNGTKTKPENKDDRIRRNKFINWVIQPRPESTVKIFDSNKYFINEYYGMDLWDIYRDSFNMIWDIGLVDCSDWHSSQNSTSVYHKFGENFYANRVYPIGKLLDKTGLGRFKIRYYESFANYADYDFLHDTMAITASRGFESPFNFYRDEDGNYYMEVKESTAVGTIYYHERKNIGALPYHYYLNTSDPRLDKVLTPVTVQPKEHTYAVHGRKTEFLNGHTGWIETYQMGRFVHVEGVVDSTGATSNTCVSLPEAKNPGWGSSTDEPWYGISEGSWLTLPMGKLNYVSFQYLAKE